MSRMRTTFGALLGTALLAAAVRPAGAADFQVNTFTNSNQRYPAAARAEDGSFVVVWESFSGSGSFYEVFGQRFDSAGDRVGGEFMINTHTSLAQARAAVAMEGDGAFVVVWESYNQEGPASNYGIFARRYDSTGAPLGSEILINEITAFNQRFPTVALDADGDFVVAWQSPAGYGSGIFARRFDSSGMPVAGQFW